jgi:DNA-directed RNA polymerase specialized sigma24 family protein
MPTKTKLDRRDEVLRRLKEFRRAVELTNKKRRDALFVEAYRAGLNTVEIAEACGTSAETVRQAITGKVKIRGRNG